MFDDMNAFIKVVECKSFAKAAKKLNLSAAVVTRRIVRLEKMLGSRLLQRSTRQVSLSEAGKIFYLEAIDIFAALESAKNRLTSFSKEVSGTLKVGLPISVSYLYVTTCLTQFLQAHPKLNIVMVSGTHLLDLLSEGFDVVVHCGHLPNSNFYYKKLGRWRKSLYASPAYLKAYGMPKKPADLSQHNCLDHTENSERTWHFRINGKIQALHVRGNMRSNSSIDLKSLAIEGLGIAYLPSFTVKQEIHDKKLVPLLESYQLSPLSMYAVYPSHKYISKKLELFMEAFSSVISE